MRSTALAIVVVCGLMALVIGVGQGLDAGAREPMPAMMPDGNDTPFGFGLKIAGTYVNDGQFGGTLTFTADGIVLGISNACCGNGFGGHIESEGMGNWARSGQHQIQVTAVVASTYYDEFHVPLPPLMCDEEGVCVDGRQGVCRVSQEINFTPDYQSYEGGLVTECWLENPALAGIFGGTGGPLPNLLDPDARPPDLCTQDLVGGPIPLAGGRLPVEYPACGELP